MARYIDADSLIRTLYIQADDDGFICCGADDLETLINAQPTADVVKVVRCKDCKYCVEHYDTYGNVLYCFCKNWYIGTDADGFCYEAERI